MRNRPQELVTRAYHRSVAARLTGRDYRPDDCTRPEFRESPRAAEARDVLEDWLLNSLFAVRRCARIIEQAPDETAAGEAVAEWLDDLLYGLARGGVPRREKLAVQLTADAMRRSDFCRMDFGAVVRSVKDFELPAGSME